MKFALGIFALCVVVVAIAGTGGADDASTAASSEAGRPAPPALQAIWSDNLATMTDCEQLQTQFNMAEHRHDRMLDAGNIDEARIATDYMSAVDDRLEAVGCYD